MRQEQQCPSGLINLCLKAECVTFLQGAIHLKWNRKQMHECVLTLIKPLVMTHCCDYRIYTYIKG